MWKELRMSAGSKKWQSQHRSTKNILKIINKKELNWVNLILNLSLQFKYLIVWKIMAGQSCGCFQAAHQLEYKFFIRTTTCHLLIWSQPIKLPYQESIMFFSPPHIPQIKFMPQKQLPPWEKSIKVQAKHLFITHWDNSSGTLRHVIYIQTHYSTTSREEELNILT